MRGGDRSEYLAVYLLSALGLVTQVPRQEDIGYDLICSLADQESGLLSFRNHYAVSVKSASSPEIVLAPPESKEKEVSYTSHLDWLFHLELPLMLGVVDKKKQSISLFTTLPAWFLYHENLPECGSLELVPRMVKGDENPDVGKPVPGDAQEALGGRKHFKVDLGHPITVICADELKDSERLRKKKASLRAVIELAAESAIFAKLHTPFLWWFNVTIPEGYIAGETNPDGISHGRAWYVATCKNEEQLNQMLRSLSRGLMSAALLFKSVGRGDLLDKLRDTIRLLPPDSVFPEVRKALPEILG